MKKNYWKVAAYAVLIVLALLLIYRASKSSFPSNMALSKKVTFIGEYSQNGSEWEPLEEDTHFSALKGDLRLRGKFSEEFGLTLSYYLNHISLTIIVDGEPVWEDGAEGNRAAEIFCSSHWGSWYNTENIQRAKEVGEIELLLQNPHTYGNANAYNEFLDAMYLGGKEMLEYELENEGQLQRVMAFMIIIIAVALFGVAWGCFSYQLPQYQTLIKLGMLSLFMGAFIWFDAVDISYISRNMVFNSHMWLCCMRLALLFLIGCMERFFTGKRKRIIEVGAVLLGTVNGLLIIAALTGKVHLYDTGICWAVAQGLVTAAALLCCILEFVKNRGAKPPMLYTSSVFCAAVMVELINGSAGWWSHGRSVKMLFTIFFVVHIAKTIQNVLKEQRTLAKAKELEDALHNSRIVLEESQIRMHFVFNLLTAISGMCEYDPVKADETIVRFSRYLRRHIDVIEKDGLIPLSKEVEYLEDYIALEQVRYEDKIRFLKEVEPLEFAVPALTLQPVVENAIKHGILPKKEGGTIALYIRKEFDTVIIKIIDDGVGFLMEELDKVESVGLRNVRFRLEHMVDGRMRIDSKPGHGTEVTMIIPYKGAE